MSTYDEYRQQIRESNLPLDQWIFWLVMEARTGLQSARGYSQIIQAYLEGKPIGRTTFSEQEAKEISIHLCETTRRIDSILLAFRDELISLQNQK